MPNVKNETERDLVRVCQTISETHTLDADQSVFRTLIAIVRRLVLITNVKIHVLAFAELMLNAEFKIIPQSVSV